MDIIIDMNLSPAWVPFLQQHGYQATHWTTLGPPDAADSVIMDRARADHAIVLTHDLDFGAMLAQSQLTGPSVIQVRTQSPLVETIGPLVINVIQNYATELATGALLVIEPERQRLRLLPLNPN